MAPSIWSPSLFRSRRDLPLRRRVLENLIDVFLNNLVMRLDASGDPTFMEFLARNRPGGSGYRIFEPFHENLSDEIFKRRFSKSWLFTDPYRVKVDMRCYLLACFDNYVLNMPPLCSRNRPRPFAKSKC